jgi:hypothetical protein
MLATDNIGNETQIDEQMNEEIRRPMSGVKFRNAT